jgi:hypothetical protein
MESESAVNRNGTPKAVQCKDRRRAVMAEPAARAAAF